MDEEEQMVFLTGLAYLFLATAVSVVYPSRPHPRPGQRRRFWVRPFLRRRNDRKDANTMMKLYRELISVSVYFYALIFIYCVYMLS
jgi:hypothetical protein